ncbi:hypothetical protein MNBD_GAMMA16-567 [hydrothermal vent metagenome]|uniref:YcxB-like protein domain-containing protein n=1 Tax=hydrothermal vent metagenome TaxID=652676 RepID=A0A3B0ZFK7_9ZZZZ
MPIMNEDLKFVTSKNQYLFSLLVNNIQLAFLGSLTMAVSSMLFASESNSSPVATAFLSIFFMIFAISIISIVYVNIRVSWFKSELPKMIISDDGVYVNELGNTKQIKWSDITKVEVKGRFRKIIKLNGLKRSPIYEIEYYLFSPAQRRKIIPAIATRISGR